MMILMAGLAVLSGVAFLVYRKRRSKRFFDPHHEQAFEVLVQNFPDAVEESKQERTANA